MNKKIVIAALVLFGINAAAIEERFPIIYVATTEGRVIQEVNSRVKHPIASLTKVMNVLVSLEEVNKGKFKLNDKVKFEADTAYVGGGAISAWQNDVYSIEDLVKAELVFSSNNGAYALGKHIGGGNLDNFVSLMNKKAKELNLKDTHFVSPAGLPSRLNGHRGMDISTARDLFSLSKYAIEHTNMLDYSSLKYVQFPDSRDPFRLYYNKNHNLGKYGVVGLKTGFHVEAGFNIINVAKMGDSTVISISMNSETSKDRDQLQRDILENLEKKLEKYIDKNTSKYVFDIKDHKEKTLEGVLSEDVMLLNLGSEYTSEIRLEENLENVKKGDKIGVLTVYDNDEVVVEKDILSVRDNRLLAWYEKVLRFITFGRY